MPAFGLLGSLSALVLLIVHLFRTNQHMLYYIGGIFAVVFVAEFFYFERDEIEEEVEEIERDVEKEEREIEEEVEKVEEDVKKAFEKEE